MIEVHNEIDFHNEAAPPGLDLGRLSQFFEQLHPGGIGRPVRARLIAGGRSNLTYEISTGTDCYILRRPPLGHVLATAHDMAREYRVMKALQNTDVPVPTMYALCADPGVLGAPFYVMERVEGMPYRRAVELERLGVARTAAVSARMVDTLASLHHINPDEVGLGDFGHVPGFLARQVNRWSKQLHASHSRPLPGAAELAERLARELPEQSEPGIVHGDFRLDNLLVDREDRVAAVIDWEMATLGDPLTDLGLLLAYQHLAELDGAGAVTDASTAPGFLTGDEMLERYAVVSGRDVSAMGFYRGLACFKLAVILEGIHYRYTQGQTVGEGFDRVGAMVEPMLAAGLDSLRGRY